MVDAMLDALKRSSGNLSAWGTLLFGVAISLWAGWYLSTLAVQDAKEEFDFDAQVIISHIEGRFNAHRQVLLGGTALFAASENVSRDEWRQFAQHMAFDKQFQGIQGLGYAQLIPKSKLSEHQAQMRRQGFPEYEVRPVGAREVYSSIIYIEPFKDRNLRAFGYDMYSEPVRRAAMDKAAELNDAVLSGKVVLVQETSRYVQAGTLMYMPVYRHGARTDTVEQRRNALLGWVYSPFRMNDLMSGLTIVSGKNPEDIHMRIYDGERTDDDSLLYDSESEDVDVYRDHESFSIEKSVKLYGRVWTIRFGLGKDHVNSVDYSKSIVVAAGGVAFSFVLFFLILSVVHTRSRALKIADALTIELRQHIDAEKRLNARLELQSTALNTSASAIMITDTSGIIEWANPAFSKLTGYTLEESVGHSSGELVKSGMQDKSVYQDLWATIRAGNSWHGELINRRKNRELYTVDLTITPMKNSEGEITHYVAVNQDISERKLVDATLRAAKEVAENAVKVKSEFLANMSHEVRTPMNAIIGMTELALDTDLDAEQREYLSLLQSSAHALLRVVNDVLDYSKIETGKMTLESIDFDLHYLLADAVKSLAINVDRQVELLLNIAPEVPLHVGGDPGRLRQIIINLLGNAIKFTHAGEIEVAVREADEAPVGRVHLQFIVRDTGIGIPADKFKSIFESFTQADNSTTRKYGGTGLGLSISAQLVELMGGHISLESVEGRGSTFQFTLDMSKPVQAAALIETLDAVAGMAILVVDDNDSHRILIERQLRAMKMEPTLVPSGESALAAIEASLRNGTPFPLLMIDMLMPNMDGFELVERIQKEQDVGASIIMMLTSDGQRQHLKKCREAGLMNLLFKPISESELRECIGNALGLTSSVNGQQGNKPVLPSPRKRLKLLLAEDTLVNQILAVRLLEKLGHEVTIANNGVEAVEQWKRAKFDAILMDVDMPEMNGYEATRCIREIERERGSHIPIVAMTAHAIQGTKERCVQNGMDDYLSKPIGIEVLRSKLSSIQGDADADGGSGASTADSLEIFDLRKTLSELGNDMEIFKSIAETYLLDFPAYWHKLESAVEAHDAVSIKKTLHSIKGMSSIFAGDKLVRLLSQIEAQEIPALSRESLGELKAALEQLASLIDAARQAQ